MEIPKDSKVKVRHKKGRTFSWAALLFFLCKPFVHYDKRNIRRQQANVNTFYKNNYEAQHNSAIVLTLPLLHNQPLYSNPLVEKYDFTP